MIVTVATLLSSEPSVALYVNVSVPKKFAFGMYWNEPSAFSVSVPLAGALIGRGVATVIGFVSTSLVSTPGAATLSVVSSFVE